METPPSPHYIYKMAEKRIREHPVLCEGTLSDFFLTCCYMLLLLSDASEIGDCHASVVAV
jgi:hypothetical protein